MEFSLLHRIDLGNQKFNQGSDVIYNEHVQYGKTHPEKKRVLVITEITLYLDKGDLVCLLRFKF